MKLTTYFKSTIAQFKKFKWILNGHFITDFMTFGTWVKYPN